MFLQRRSGLIHIMQVPSRDIVHHNTSSRISLHDYEHDWELTEAFYNPHILVGDTAYLSNNDRFIIVSPRTESTQHVIVIRTIIDKTRIAWLLIFLLIISPCLGVIVGLCTHNAEVGIATSAGVFALASFLQGLAAWFHR